MKNQENPVLDLSFLECCPMEEDIYLCIDKLQALCSTQTMIDSSAFLPEPSVRFHYSLVIEEQVTALRSLLDKLFD